MAHVGVVYTCVHVCACIYSRFPLCSNILFPFTGNLWFVCAVNFNVHLWYAQTINFHERETECSNATEINCMHVCAGVCVCVEWETHCSGLMSKGLFFLTQSSVHFS